MVPSLCCGREVLAIHQCNYYCTPTEGLHADILWVTPHHSVERIVRVYNLQHPARACCAFTAAFELLELREIAEEPKMPAHVQAAGVPMEPWLMILRHPDPADFGLEEVFA